MGSYFDDGDPFKATYSVPGAEASSPPQQNPCSVAQALSGDQLHQYIPITSQESLEPPPLLPADPGGGSHWQEQQQPNQVGAGAGKAQSNATDQKKHRRTRSGCYTCRQRRVKCDETRPICERCRKGKRECVYPPPQLRKPTSRSSLRASGGKHSPGINSGGESPSGKTTGIARESQSHFPGLDRVYGSFDLFQTRGGIAARQSVDNIATDNASRQDSDKTSSCNGISASPQSDATRSVGELVSPKPGVGGFPGDFSSYISSGVVDTALLTSDVCFFLDYYVREVRPHHYFMRRHAEEFFLVDVLQRALLYPPLLNALVAFAAYHYSFNCPNGKLYTFLNYYQSSLSGLLRSLQSGDEQNEIMLLTVLQLSTFEEYLGDWYNLLKHHEAACRMVAHLYTPQALNRDPFHRNLFLWIVRFDVASAVIVENEPFLKRNWYLPMEDTAKRAVAERPDDIERKLFLFSIQCRKLCKKMATFAATAKAVSASATLDANNPQEIVAEVEEGIQSLAREIDSLLNSMGASLPASPVCADFNGEEQQRAYRLWLQNEVTACRVDFAGTYLMYRVQAGIIWKQDNSDELAQLSAKICQQVERMLQISTQPEKLLLPFQQTVALALLFLPADEPHVRWGREKMAWIEAQGYIFPKAMHARLSNHWNAPDVMQWWLPGGEKESELLRETKEWTEERMMAMDMPTHLQNMSHLSRRINEAESSSMQQWSTIFKERYT